MSIARIPGDLLTKVVNQSGIIDVLEGLANLTDDTELEDDLRVLAVKLRAKERRDALGRDVLE